MIPPVRLSWSQRICYGVGHSLNDLTATMWFSYLIVYLQLVLKFDSTYAGLILLVGQVADAIATPLLGYEASNETTNEGSLCRRYGRRKSLHLIGTACVLASFPFIFSTCPGCERASEKALTVMLIPLVVIFQFGWAATQISHLSLIPVISPYENERDFLNIFRYAVNIASDIGTYIVVWSVFDLTPEPTGDDGKISSHYADKFMIIVITIEVIGAFFSAIFHIGVKEVKQVVPKLTNKEQDHDSSYGSTGTEEEELTEKINLNWKDWLKEIHFYQVGLLYMLSRLFQNMSGVFIPLYLQESRIASTDLIAKVPLVMNISGFVISCLLQKFFKVISKKSTFLLGTALGIGSCAWVLMGSGEVYWTRAVYGMAVLMGMASSILVVSALSFAHDLIGTSVESGAFVYGFMSFWDKMANGVCGMTVQHLHSIMCKECDWFYKSVIAYGIGGIGVLSILVLLTLLSAKLGTRTITEKKAPEFRTVSVTKFPVMESDSIEERQNLVSAQAHEEYIY